MQSLLNRASPSDVLENPFPHLVIKNALAPEVYERLAEQFPSAEILLNGRRPENNKNFRYTANEILDDRRISTPWREFVRYHVSGEFFREVRTVFGDHIRRLSPHSEAHASRPLADWHTSIRFREPPRDVALECQIAYGTPVERESRMIGPHVDREVALYAGLFYLRDDRDDSHGGALELYRFKDEPVFAEDRHYVSDDCVEVVKTIPYAKNTLVMFLHSPYSLHGVSPRSVTTFPRRHVNLVGELTTKVFDVGPFVTRRRSDV